MIFNTGGTFQSIFVSKPLYLNHKDHKRGQCCIVNIVLKTTETNPTEWMRFSHLRSMFSCYRWTRSLSKTRRIFNIFHRNMTINIWESSWIIFTKSYVCNMIVSPNGYWWVISQIMQSGMGTFMRAHTNVILFHTAQWWTTCGSLWDGITCC